MPVEPPCVPALYAFLLGSIASGSLLIAFIRLENSSPHMQPFAAYLGSLALFHFLEYYWQAKYHPSTTTSEAFLLNHSKEYLMAIMTGLIEYSLKRLVNLSPVPTLFRLLGLFLLGFGILLRSLAMITAAESFSHDIKDSLDNGHKLVREGVYGICRHPSYLGFFAFAIGGQIVLGNFISMLIFFIVLQKFFRERVIIEESILIKRFPKEYPEYKEKTWSGIAFYS